MIMEILDATIWRINSFTALNQISKLLIKTHTKIEKYSDRIMMMMSVIWSKAIMISNRINFFKRINKYRYNRSSLKKVNSKYSILKIKIYLNKNLKKRLLR